MKVLHFIEETHSSENTLDLELNSCPLCAANSLGGQGTTCLGSSQFPHLLSGDNAHLAYCRGCVKLNAEKECEPVIAVSKVQITTEM